MDQDEPQTKETQAMPRLNVEEAEDWIVGYLRSNTAVSCLCTDFHDKFHAKFGGARKLTNWGAQPVHAAMRLLSSMHKRGILEMRRVSLGGNWQPGFPKIANSYSLTSLYKNFSGAKTHEATLT